MRNCHNELSSAYLTSRPICVTIKSLHYFTRCVHRAHWTYRRQSFTCWKSTIETLEKVRNMFSVNNKDTTTTSLSSFWCLYCSLWTYSTPHSVNPPLIMVGWHVLIYRREDKHCFLLIMYEFWSSNGCLSIEGRISTAFY